MRRTSLGMLALLALASLAVSSLVVRALADRRAYLAPVAAPEWLAILALALATLIGGLRVRAYLQGKRPNLDPIRAARTWALAKAAGITGSILIGRYLATVLATIPDWQLPGQAARLIGAGIAALAAIALTVVGVIVERFCELPPTDSETEPNKGEVSGAPLPSAPFTGTDRG